MLALFLFNLGGYRLWFYYVQQQSDARFEASLDKNNYNEKELITLEIPLSMPYLTDKADCERVDGEVNIKGKIYKYVKRKVTDGKLVLYCLPDEQKTSLQSAKQAYLRFANDVNNNGQDHSKKTGQSQFAGGFSHDFTQEDQGAAPAFVQTAAACVLPACNDLSLATAIHLLPEQPPEATANCIC